MSISEGTWQGQGWGSRVGKGHMSPHGLGGGCVQPFFWLCQWERPKLPEQGSAQQLPRALLALARGPGGSHAVQPSGRASWRRGWGCPLGPGRWGHGELPRQEEALCPVQGAHSGPGTLPGTGHPVILAEKLAFECGVGATM